MTTILNGLLGGVLVGLLTGVVAQLVDVERSATAVLLTGILGSRGGASRLTEFVAQSSYGGLAGGALVALELFVLGVLGVPPAVGEAFGVTLAWSALLFGTVVVLWRFTAHSFDRSRLRELLAYHLVYGLGLGVWIRLTWIT